MLEQDGGGEPTAGPRATARGRTAARLRSGLLGPRSTCHRHDRPRCNRRRSSCRRFASAGAKSDGRRRLHRGSARAEDRRRWRVRVWLAARPSPKARGYRTPRGPKGTRGKRGTMQRRGRKRPPAGLQARIGRSGLALARRRTRLQKSTDRCPAQRNARTPLTRGGGRAWTGASTCRHPPRRRGSGARHGDGPAARSGNSRDRPSRPPGPALGAGIVDGSRSRSGRRASLHGALVKPASAFER